MIAPGHSMKVFLCRKPVDFRYGYDRLSHHIEGELSPYKELRETIPSEHIQGRKVANICTNRMEELLSMLAEKTEHISYLDGELFGKKKNNKRFAMGLGESSLGLLT